MDRAATANQYAERKGQIRLNTNPDDDALNDARRDSQLRRADSKLDVLYERLKACQGENGFTDPAKVLQTMNMVQMEEDPQAYVPDMEKLHLRKEEDRRIEALW